MAPKVDAAEAKLYIEAITRIGDMMALASLLPVLFECRFGTKLERLHRDAEERKTARLEAAQGKQKQKQKQKQDKQPKEEEQQQPQAQDKEEPSKIEWPLLPVGVVSILLFVAAEVISCWSLFVPSAKAGAKKKGKGAAAEGALGVLLEAIRKGAKTVEAVMKKEKKQTGEPGITGSLEKAVAVVGESLASPEAFDAAHTIAMLVALLAILLSMAGHLVQPSLKTVFRKGRLPLTGGVLALVPACLLGLLQWHSVGKAWKALQAEDLLPSLPRALRVAALLLCAAPGAGQAPEVPVFGAFQAGSLAATISAEIASGRLAASITPFMSGSYMKTMFDSRVMTFLIPTLLALLWTSLMHLRKSKLHLMLAAVLSMMSSPLLLITGANQAAPMLGIANDIPTGLVKVFGALHVALSMSFLMAGGTLTLLAVMVLGNVLMRIHGTDMFAGVVL